MPGPPPKLVDKAAGRSGADRRRKRWTRPHRRQQTRPLPDAVDKTATGSVGQHPPPPAADGRTHQASDWYVPETSNLRARSARRILRHPWRRPRFQGHRCTQAGACRFESGRCPCRAQHHHASGGPAGDIARAHLVVVRWSSSHGYRGPPSAAGTRCEAGQGPRRPGVTARARATPGPTPNRTHDRQPTPPHHQHRTAPHDRNRPPPHSQHPTAPHHRHPTAPHDRHRTAHGINGGPRPRVGSGHQDLGTGQHGGLGGPKRGRVAARPSDLSRTRDTCRHRRRPNI